MAAFITDVKCFCSFYGCCSMLTLAIGCCIMEQALNFQPCLDDLFLGPITFESKVPKTSTSYDKTWLVNFYLSCYIIFLELALQLCLLFFVSHKGWTLNIILGKFFFNSLHSDFIEFCFFFHSVSNLIYAFLGTHLGGAIDRGGPWLSHAVQEVVGQVLPGRLPLLLHRIAPGRAGHARQGPSPEGEQQD